MTISVYPTITARVLPLNDFVPDAFFIPVCCFLNFNLFGNIHMMVSQTDASDLNIKIFLVACLLNGAIHYKIEKA